MRTNPAKLTFSPSAVPVLAVIAHFNGRKPGLEEIADDAALRRLAETRPVIGWRSTASSVDDGLSGLVLDGDGFPCAASDEDAVGGVLLGYATTEKAGLDLARRFLQRMSDAEAVEFGLTVAA